MLNNNVKKFTLVQTRSKDKTFNAFKILKSTALNINNRCGLGPYCETRNGIKSLLILLYFSLNFTVNCREIDTLFYGFLKMKTTYERGAFLLQYLPVLKYSMEKKIKDPKDTFIGNLYSDWCQGLSISGVSDIVSFSDQ